MKLLCFVALSICAIAHGANVDSNVLSQELSVSKELGYSQYELHLENPEETKELILTEDEAQVVEALFQERLITDAVQNTLEQLRYIIINGNDDVPPLDPFIANAAGPFSYHLANGVLAEGTLRNLRMEGLRWFVYDRINVNAPRLTFGITLTIPWLTVTSGYDVVARISLLTHNAAGNIRIFAHRIEVGFDMRMGTNLLGGHLVLRELDIHIDIHDTQFSITGMTGSAVLNNLISSTIQNISQEVIQNEMVTVSEILSKELFEVINEILKQFTVSDIFG